MAPRIFEGDGDSATSKVLAPIPVILLARPRDVDGLSFILLLLLLLRLRLLSLYRQRSSCEEQDCYEQSGDTLHVRFLFVRGAMIDSPARTARHIHGGMVPMISQMICKKIPQEGLRPNNRHPTRKLHIMLVVVTHRAAMGVPEGGSGGVPVVVQ
jgi:hypothetical protein